MNNYEFHARKEFQAAGWTDETGKFHDRMQEIICNHVLKLLEVLHSEEHSGTTAPYTIDLFSKLANFKPLTPLTGEDWEWTDVSRESTHTLYQNKRLSSVFKDADGAYNIEGKVFWEWSSSPDIDDGKPFKSHFTCRESRVPVTFPYTVPESPEYVFRSTERFPKEEL